MLCRGVFRTNNRSHVWHVARTDVVDVLCSQPPISNAASGVTFIGNAGLLRRKRPSRFAASLNKTRAVLSLSLSLDREREREGAKDHIGQKNDGLRDGDVLALQSEGESSGDAEELLALRGVSTGEWPSKCRSGLEGRPSVRRLLVLRVSDLPRNFNWADLAHRRRGPGSASGGDERIFQGAPHSGVVHELDDGFACYWNLRRRCKERPRIDPEAKQGAMAGDPRD